MRRDIIGLTSSLVSVQSINPLIPGVETEKVLGGEKENNLILKDVVEQFGCKAAFVEKEKERANLAAVLKGTGGGRSLILNGHIDTVTFGDSKGWKWEDPISGRVVDGRLYGRGATDMKGGIASMTRAVEAIGKAGYRLKGDVTIESVVGEETMSNDLGTDAVTEAGYTADAAIVTEPTAPPIRLAVVPVTSGGIWLKIRIEGKAVHACVRDELIRPGGGGDAIGVSALEKGVKVIQALQDLEQRWGLSKRHPLFKPGHFTLLPSLMNAGVAGVHAPDFVSDFCEIDYSITYHPRQSYESVKREVQGCLRSVCSQDTWLRVHPPKLQWMSHWPPAETPTSHAIVKTLAASHERATGRRATLSGFAAVCDATFLDAKGIPTVVYGPGDILVAHAFNEYVETSELVDSAKSIALTLMDWCGYERI
jgi:formylaminopyrimidine deformylase